MSIKLPVDAPKDPLLEPGLHRFKILTAAEVTAYGRHELRLRCEVLNGPSQRGTKVTQNFSLDENKLWIVGILAKRLGVIERGTATDSLEAEIEASDFEGLEVVVNVEHGQSERTGNLYNRWSAKEVWAPDDAECPGVFNSPAAAVQPAATPAVTDWSNV